MYYVDIPYLIVLLPHHSDTVISHKYKVVVLFHPVYMSQVRMKTRSMHV
jgi:hypothetical protein